MKNFRKVLALILVVATLFSFVAMASAKKAEEYADYSEVKNVVAVDVLTALGINEGSDGKFHPAATIDRDEVAAMIARLRNGGKFDPTYYVGADNVFADVKGQWSEGYVTYCYQLGIIDGFNASTFAPDNKVKTVEVLKLLLCVLGYDADLQGYVGPNWSVSVIRDAEKMGLTTGIDSANMYKEATRDQVALMFLNALQARLVYGYVSENIITLTNSLVKEIPWIDVPDMANPATELAYNNAIISMWTLGDILNVGSVDAQDCFGRPMTKWYIGTAWSKFYPVPYSNKTVNGDNVYGTTAAEKAAQAAATVYHNGQVCGHALTDLLGKGVIVERYADRVVVIDTFMAIVESVSVRRAEMTLSNNQTIKNTVGAKVGDVVMYTLCDKVGTEGYSCGDKQAYVGTMCGDFYHDISIVAPVEVKVDETHRVTAAPANSYIVTAEGNTYYYSKNVDVETYALGAAADDGKYMNWSEKGKTKWLYLDSEGYIQYWCAPAPAATSYEVGYFVENTNTWTKGNTGTNNEVGAGAVSYAADVVNMNAEGPTTVAINGTFYEVMKNAYHVTQKDYLHKIGVLAAYGTAIEGGYKAAKVAGVESYMDSATGELKGEKWDTSWEKNPYDLNMHANADTKYLIRTYDFATGTNVYSTGLGYKDVADYIGKLTMDNVASSGLIDIPVIQYLDLDDNGIIDYLFVDAFYKNVAAEYIHVLKMEENIGVAGLGKYFPAFDLYSAYVNGEKAYVAYYALNGETLSENTLYKTTAQAVNATYKGAPIYVALTEANLVDLSTAYKFNQIRIEGGQIALVKYDPTNGHLSVTERLPAAYNDDLTIYVVSAADDVTTATYTGTEFVAKFASNEWFTGNEGAQEDWCSVYALGSPINTLIIELK